jgi:hypothetical protein
MIRIEAFYTLRATVVLLGNVRSRASANTKLYSEEL